MKNSLLIFFCLPLFVFSQDFNAYKYFTLVNISSYDNNSSSDSYGIYSKSAEYFENIGLKKLEENEVSNVKNKCLILNIAINRSNILPPNSGYNTVGLRINDCKESLGIVEGKGMSFSVQQDFNIATKKLFNNISRKYKLSKPYLYDSTKTPYVESKLYYSNNDTIDLTSENAIRKYFDENGTELIEGIWEYTSSGVNTYRLSILKSDYKYNAYVTEPSGVFFSGDKKATLETAASDEVLTINWIMGDKSTIKKVIGKVDNNALISFNIVGEVILYKVYPKFDKNNRQKKVKNGDWAGNGSGIIISKSGHIITNYHVIDDADDIEVEFILDDEVQKFNAEIIQVDKTNDLAIIKIVDVNFDGIDSPPYNFKTRSSDVGTKVYAFGYPMALSIMGKEIKVTDGIISSKTGFDGNITTYQISAPIQGGNSGGPLFDDKGNFIGINSSGINKKLADNVGYSIKTSYVLNLIDILPKSIDLPSNKKLANLPLTEQIKEISKYVVLVKVK